MKQLRFALALGLVVAWSSPAGAEEPSGGYTIGINGESGLVVPTGAGEVCQDGVCVSTDVSTNPDGVVSGTGNVTIDSLGADLDLSLSGRVSGLTSNPKVVLAFLVEGTADGVDVSGKGKMKCVLPEGGGAMLDCTGKMKACAFQLGQKLGCEKLPFETQVAFVRQSFELDLDLETVLDSTVTGGANLQVGAITLASYAVKGKYKPSADTSTLVLKSADPDMKTKVVLKNVVLAGGGATAGTAVFKAMGQKGVVELPSMSPTAASR